MTRRRMGGISLGDPRFDLQIAKDNHQHGVVTDEIKGLIRVYKDGHVERVPVVAEVACTLSPVFDVASRDVIVDKFTGVWARFYVPQRQGKLPLLVYFHGGGFCIGSAAWRCYHEFLAKLASDAGCLIMSVNYRLAPENRLPAAFEDGFNAVKWVRQHALCGSTEQSWWSSHCNFSRVFLGGDSAGANIAYNTATRFGSPSVCESSVLKPVCLKGVVLIQPFFGGEARTDSEKSKVQSTSSALSLTASDIYWRLALPLGANRDHEWCNPLAKGSAKLEALRLSPTLVCIAEMDVLKDRNLELCVAMKRAGKSVEHVMYLGVGHAFQVLNNYQLSQPRTHEMLAHVKAFINR